MPSPFISQQTPSDPIEIPGYPGEWVRLRRLKAGDVEGMTITGSRVTLSYEVAASAVCEWSFDIPITPDAIRDLEVDVYMWLSNEINAYGGIRSEAEKKDSTPPSLPASPPAGPPVAIRPKSPTLARRNGSGHTA